MASAHRQADRASGDRRGCLGFFAVLGPALLVAATGVGAGDVATAAYAGAGIGLGVLWAAGAGATMKFVVSEALARWQIATGRTILEGAMVHLGPVAYTIFVPYLLFWTFMVAGSLVNASGSFAHALLPLGSEQTSKLVYGVATSGICAAMVWLGGYRLVERVMGLAVAGMFLGVLATAVLLKPDPAAVLRGLTPLALPSLNADQWKWAVAYIGGVGGTVTIICYSYWMREAGRHSPQHLRRVRLDLLIAYALSALFGMSVVVIASGMEVSGKGSALAIGLANRIGEAMGPAGRFAFLVGAFCAAFTSVLGVWQAVPYIYADLWNARNRLGKGSSAPPLEPSTHTSLAYRLALLFIAIPPLVLLRFPFREVQKIYAITGAYFIPMLAIVLLLLTTRRTFMGSMRSRWPTVGVLALALAFFAYAALIGAAD